MRNKLTSAKTYVKEHAAPIALIGTVTSVYGLMCASSYFDYKAASVNYETARTENETLRIKEGHTY